ncbi:hypothetical protein HCN44_006544 [Aphidius gifuensis]|uniref:Uncharacterized protein n=2 Tax=Aphidius gifuensis TaxID=684658 RepID=A0A834Y209_APHGI|nr:hypothetical protein HCN44_006544 [Aphidius gifuensis]
MMHQYAKEAHEKYQDSDNINILLAVSYILTNRPEDALQQVSGFIDADDKKLSALIIQSFAYRLNINKDKQLIIQIDNKIHDERRKLNFSSLSKAGLIYYLFKKYEKAKEYTDKAYKINSNDFDVLINSTLIDLQLYNGKNNYLSKLMNDYPRKLIVLLLTSKFHEINNTNEQSILILNALIVRYEKLTIPFIEKLVNYLSLKNWEQVLEISNRILSIDPNNIDALKAEIIVKLCKDNDLITAGKSIHILFKNLQRYENKNIEIFIINIKLLMSLITSKDNNCLLELSKVCEKIIQNDTNVSEPMIQLGNIFLLLKNYKEAEHWYKNAIKIDNRSFEGMMGLAYCQLMEKTPGSSDIAKQQLDFLMELQSSTNNIHPKLYYMSAKIHKNNSKQSIENLDMAIKLILNNIDSYSYGYRYLYELNPSFSLDIAEEYLLHLPKITVSNNDSTIDKPILIILEKITDACCGCINGLLLFAKVKLYYCDYDGAMAILKKLLDNVDSTNATAHLLMAQIFINQGNYQSASQSLEVGLSYNFKVRDDPLYHLLTGIIEKQNNNIELSIDSLKTGMSLMNNTSSSSSFSLADQATIYLELIKIYSDIKKFDEANALMNEAIQIFSSTIEESRIKIGRAELSLDMDDIDRSIKYLSDIKPNEPYYLEGHKKLAEIHLNYRKDRYEFSKCYRELVEHCPCSKTYSMLGDAYMAIQEPDRAIESYELSLKNNPNDKILASKMGNALIKTHQYTRAVDYYTDIVRQKNCNDLKIDMAELFMKMKQYDKAEKILIQELQDGRLSSDLNNLELRGKQLLLLAKIREKSERIDDSLKTLKEAKENQIRCIQRASISSDVIVKKNILAEICLTMADYSTTIRDFNQAIEHYKDVLQYRNNDINALLNLSKLYMQINDLDKCQQYCTALLNADPNNELASVMMADLAFRKVDFETAAFHFRQLLMRRPTYWTALARLIEVSRRTGNIEDLNEWLLRAENATENSNNDAGFYYCSGLLDWRCGKLNSALRKFNAARRDQEWGQQAIYNMIEICLDPDDESSLSNEAFNEEDAEYQDSRTMALKTAQRLLQELNPKGNPHEMLTHRLLGNFFLLTTKIKTNIERALADCTILASQDTLKDHVGPALGLATAHILLKQVPRARTHLKRVAKNLWTFEDAEYLERCWLMLANIYVQSNKYDIANELLKKILQHNATCIRAHELAGYISEKEQNYRDAAICYSQAWKFGGKLKLQIGYKLAYCFFKCKKYADAIQACNEVLLQSPDYPKIRKDILEKSINNIRT